MAHQTLYRRYRPGRFADLKGQGHVVTALRNAVATDTVGHAYLFSGPRGTGKTSTARILARALNCESLTDGEPCAECDSCVAIAAGTSMDVVELDAASNNGVDNVRELVKSTALASPGRTKVYVLDEVHQLTDAAANALLKTLEEAPPHVVFVLATTVPHKVFDTIRSRTQHYDFRLLDAAELDDHVRWVVADAGLDVDDAGIAHAIRAGGGSARDTLSALDQVVASGGVTQEVVEVADMLDAIADRDTGQVLVLVHEAVRTGRDPHLIGEMLIEHLRDAFLAAMKADLGHLTATEQEVAGARAERLGPPLITRSIETVGAALVDMRQAPDPRVVLEVALARLTRPEIDPSPAALLERIERLERGGAPATSEQPTPAPAEAPSSSEPPPQRAEKSARSGGSPASEARSALGAHTKKRRRPEPEPEAPTPTLPASAPDAAPAPDHAPGPTGTIPSRDDLTQAWGDTILGALPKGAKARFAAGRFVDVTDGAAVFALPNEAHRKRCDEKRTEVEGVLAAHFGVSVPMRIVVDEGSTPPAAAPSSGASTADAASTDSEPVESIEKARTLENADVPASGVERLTEAFPGSEVVEPDDTGATP